LSTPALSLFIAGDVATTGTVTIPGLSFTQAFTVTPGTVTTVTLPSTAQVVTADGVENRGIHVTANAEVSVYGLNRVSATTDAFLGLPTDILGTDYIVLGYSNTQVHSSAGTQLGIVATQDGTVVTITPSRTTGARLVGVPYNVTLNQGQAYQLRNTTFGFATDLSGTFVTSDKPIAVFGGNQCTNIPNGNFVACDHVVEEIPPTSTWGKSFVTMPLATRTGGDTFRILASEPATIVQVNGVPVATLNRGQLHERIISGPATISADKPVLVSQYSNSSSFDGVTSDPFMMLIPPFEQFLGSYTVTTPATGFTNYINVVAPTSSIGSVLLDGVAIPAAAFTPIPGSSFSGAQRQVAQGSHRLTGSLPFGAFMYGYASFDSYGYPGGLALGEVASVTNVVLSPASATNPINTQHCVNAAVTDQNGAPLSGIRVDFGVTGVNPTTGFGFTGTNGIAQFCYTGTVAGTDSIVGNVGTVVSNTATKTWTSLQAVTCDVDGDRDVDLNDINAINAARNTTASPGDPRDANGDGTINVVDSRFCVVKCTRAGCAVGGGGAD
jgi:hypothetical protein